MERPRRTDIGRTRTATGRRIRSVDRTVSRVDPLEPRTLFAAVTFPSATGLEFQTNGPARPPDIGDWYTTAASASTERAHYALIEVTAEMLAAGGGTVAVTVDDAESAAGAGPLDEIENAPDPTRFRLLAGDRATVLSSTVLPSGSANATPVAFSVSTPGTYFVESVTGAGPISGDNTAGLNDDDNAYTITVSEDGGLLGIFQGSLQQASVADRELFFVVGPGTTSLFLRNFDLDGGTVTYTRPSGATIAGTSSGDGLWNGPAPTTDTGGDAITGLTSADVGVWTATLAGLTVGNQTIFEPNDGDGNRIVLLDTAPQTAGNFTIGNSASVTTAAGVAVDHPFTVTNRFATADVVNLTTAGTAAGFTAALLDGAGNPLTDSTGDALADTGLLAPGESRTFTLRVTPTTAPAGASDATRVQAVSLLDSNVDPGNDTIRTVTLTTNVAAASAAPAVANAVIDCGFLRSRNATLAGEIVAGDPGPHQVSIDWGDGNITTVELAAGETAFRAGHRFRHRSACQARITVSDNEGNTSAPFDAVSRAEATVAQVFQSTLGREPTDEELRRYAEKFERCRSARSYERQAARLAKRLA